MHVQALENFRKNLRSAMEAQDISQREIAVRAGVSYPYVNRILTEKVEPTLPICDRLADAIHLPLAALLASPKKFAKGRLKLVS